MNTTPNHNDKAEADVKEKFEFYFKKWKEETLTVSSLTQIYSNLNYLNIIGLGKPAIPLILENLKTECHPWFLALRVLSENDTVGNNIQGDYLAGAKAWLDWGKGEGYIS